jgi:large subunit ribosomal protein L38e
LREFVKMARRKDATKVKIIKVKHTSKATGKTSDKYKFKIRTPRYLYTLLVATKDKADKLRQALPPALVKEEL